MDIPTANDESLVKCQCNNVMELVPAVVNY